MSRHCFFGIDSNILKFWYVQDLLKYYSHFLTQIIDSSENRTERYCGYKLPPSFLSSGNTLKIYFKSDSTMAPGGYDAYYYTVRLPSGSNYEF